MQAELNSSESALDKRGVSGDEIKQLIRETLERNRLAVISTAHQDGAPESAVINIGSTEDLELIFDTLSTYRKYSNLQKDSRVAFVIGWDQNITVQYEGNALELSGKELDAYKEAYFTKNPKARKWEARPETRYFKVTPRWIRYSDLGQKPWFVQEIRF